MGARRQGPSGATFRTAHHTSYRLVLERLSFAASTSLETWKGTLIFLGGLSSILGPFWGEKRGRGSWGISGTHPVCSSPSQWEPDP